MKRRMDENDSVKLHKNSFQIELWFESKAVIGEGPCWHQEKKLFYWVDIFSKKLFIHQSKSKIHKITELPEMIGCVVPRKSGGVIVALQNGIAALDIETKKLTYLLEIEKHLPTNRFNDGKCDPAGRLLVGTMAIQPTPGAGTLYSIDKNLQTKKLLDNLSVSNGMGWSPDYSTFYFIDSPTQKIMAFDYNLKTGNICNKRVIIRVPKKMGVPDGMTVDEKGMLWIALWGGRCVSRWNPQNGKLLQLFPIPALNVSSCTFGGHEMDELYITTARQGMSKAQLNKFPLAGSVFRFKTEVKGMKIFKFAG